MKKPAKSWDVGWESIFLAGVVAALGVGVNEAIAKSEYLPRLQHFRQLERAKDCSVYRSVYASTMSERKQQEETQKGIENILKTRREDLLQCAKELGVPPGEGDDFEEMLAESCPEKYESWLKVGYRFQINDEDLGDNRNGTELLQSQLMRDCPELPKTAKFRSYPSN